MDSASGASFITERLAQRLHLPRCHSNKHIRVFGGDMAPVHESVQVELKHLRGHMRGGTLKVHALVVPEISSMLPTHLVPFKRKWKHLRGLALADPDFGTPRRVDLLLGAGVFVQTVLNGRRAGPPGSPWAIETCF